MVLLKTAPTRFATCVFVMLLVFSPLSLWAAERWEGELTELLAAGRHDDAFTLLSQPDLIDSPAAAQHRGFLLGSGLLPTGIDRCGAVANLERAYEGGYLFVRGALDYLYGGDWAGIAALEGNASALYEVGVRTLASTIQSNPFLAFDKNRNKKDAYVYLFNSARLGNRQAEIHYLVSPHAVSAFELGPEQQVMEFQEVLCPPRETPAGR